MICPREKLLQFQKKLTEKGELVVVPRDEYEEYLLLKRAISVGKISKSERKAIEEGRREIRSRKSLTLKQLRAFLES